MEQSGFVYVLTNGYMPNIVKIGATSNNPYVRCNQISRHEGVPGDFCVAAFLQTDDIYGIESEVHFLLRNLRLSKKEFFCVSVEQAVKVLGRFGQVEGTASDSGGDE